MISDAESAVMKVLWDEPGLAAEQVKERLQNEWQLSTVKTLLNRLLSKDILRAEKSVRHFCYFPLVSKESYVANEAQSFLTRVFDGSLAPIFTHFSKHKGLKAEDRAALKRLLAELENDPS